MFSLMNMSSAHGDLTARAVIRNRALELFAQRGTDAATVRDIAAAAGVSPALVLHHYGSKAGLVEAVNEHVAGVFDDALEALAERPEELTSDPVAAGGLAELMLGALPESSPVPAYLRRLLLSGDPVGHRLFVRWYEASLALTARLTEAGVMRPADDPAARAAFLLVNDLAVVLLREHLVDVLGVDPLSREGMRRWAAEVLSAYARGVFVAGEAP
jgi:TetR/AcrR family transcriptional regulator, regulator of cefoperazone and chloramphenicol sensitivity